MSDNTHINLLEEPNQNTSVDVNKSNALMMLSDQLNYNIDMNSNNGGNIRDIQFGPAESLVKQKDNSKEVMLKDKLIDINQRVERNKGDYDETVIYNPSLSSNQGTLENKLKCEFKKEKLTEGRNTLSEPIIETIVSIFIITHTHISQLEKRLLKNR